MASLVYIGINGAGLQEAV